MKFNTQKNRRIKQVMAGRPFLSLLTILIFVIVNRSNGQELKINDLEYFEKQGVNILVFSNQYNGMFFDEKTAGIEMIHHGVRSVTGGAIRLQNTPEQWDLVPQLIDRKIDKTTNSIEVTLRYEEYDFNSRIKVVGKDKGFEISVILGKPIPEILQGKAGLNLEFLPSAYFGKTYFADEKPGTFPRYPSGETETKPSSEKIKQFAGHSTFDDRGKSNFIVPKPFVTGKNIILAPDDPERYVKIQSETELMLFDGRNLAQNGWYILRSLIPANKTGNVLTWYIEPGAVANWKRQPVIGFSQVGYNPTQEKVAVVELDKTDTALTQAAILQITPEGKTVEIFKGKVTVWGKFFRYNYLQFDFSSVTTPGIYCIKYGDNITNPFTIAENIYKEVWHPTMDVWFPVQMDHMMVNEAYRVWHGAPYLDDALQAPVNHNHFDGYSMDSVTDTKYKPFERIPGLAVGGWFDAGDFDIQTASHCAVILNLVQTWENFRVTRDETFIDQQTRFVDIHRPDGMPDILQQIEHGTLNIVAQVENIGHPVRGIIVPNLHQYHHLGDAMTETDNLPYNPNLKPFETDGKSSGTMDDRWAFTNREPFLDYYTVATLAAASRALKDYNKPLADKCLVLALKLWNEQQNMPVKAENQRMARWGKSIQLNAVLQLYITTTNKEYSTRFQELIWPVLDEFLAWTIQPALQACPYMDNNYKNRLKEYVVKYKQMADNNHNENPYGIPMSAHGWGGNSGIINWAIANYYANKNYPEIIGAEYVYKGLNYLFGCHPYSNLSFVAGVGVKSKQMTYTNNRADFSFIAGGVVPGLLVLKPDFPENKDDWPFFWGENECVIDIGAAYVFLSNAAYELSKKQ